MPSAAILDKKTQQRNAPLYSIYNINNTINYSKNNNTYNTNNTIFYVNTFNYNKKIFIIQIIKFIILLIIKFKIFKI